MPQAFDLLDGLERWGIIVPDEGVRTPWKTRFFAKSCRTTGIYGTRKSGTDSIIKASRLESRYRARQHFLHQQAANLEEALNEGLQRGREESRRDQLRETTGKIKAAGIEVALIQSVTGLTVDE
jgi:hypothetical protein